MPKRLMAEGQGMLVKRPVPVTAESGVPVEQSPVRRIASFFFFPFKALNGGDFRRALVKRANLTLK